MITVLIIILLILLLGGGGGYYGYNRYGGRGLGGVLGLLLLVPWASAACFDSLVAVRRTCRHGLPSHRTIGDLWI